MPVRLKQVTVVYGERKLQTTFAIPYNIPHGQAKETGEKEIRQHLGKLEDGFMPHIELDPECTDFFSEESNGNITMIVWPAADPKTNFTPSPMIDAFVETASELRAVRSKEAIESLINDPSTADSKKEGKRRKRNQDKQAIPSPSISNDSAAKQPSDELSLDSLMRRITRLEEVNATSNGRIDALEMENKQLKSEMSKLRENVLIDRAAINKIRQRILLDLARDKLATLCGFVDWKDWKMNGDRETMASSAKTRILTDATAGDGWKDVAQHPNALDFIVSRNSIRLQGNVAAHKSDECVIAESIFSLGESSRERSVMTVIFTAYFGHAPIVQGLE